MWRMTKPVAPLSLLVIATAATSILPGSNHQTAVNPPAHRTRIQGPLTPDQEAASFQLPAGLRIELVAAEPQVESPVAMAFDENGRLWVVEMRDYPNGPSPGRPPEGRIKILDDRDGNGRYQHSTLFADHLLFANGLMPWRGGVIVT